MQLTFLLEEPPANPSRSPASEPDWLTPGETSPSHILPLLQNITPDGFFGRTCPEFSAAIPTTRPIQVHRQIQWIWNSTAKKWEQATTTTQSKPAPSAPFWPDFQNSGMGPPTEFSTLSSVEHMASPELSRSVGAVCSLSDILETGDVPQRYYLTARACAGILRRAEKRGKTLPPQLARALQAVAGLGRTST